MACRRSGSGGRRVLGSWCIVGILTQFEGRYERRFASFWKGRVASVPQLYDQGEERNHGGADLDQLCRQRGCVLPLHPDTGCHCQRDVADGTWSPWKLPVEVVSKVFRSCSVTKDIVLCFCIQTLASPLHEERVIAVRILNTTSEMMRMECRSPWILLVVVASEIEFQILHPDTDELLRDEQVFAFHKECNLH